MTKMKKKKKKKKKKQIRKTKLEKSKKKKEEGGGWDGGERRDGGGTYLLPSQKKQTHRWHPLDICVHLHELVVQVLPVPSSTPWYMAWQMACQSSSTSGGSHLLAPTLVLMKERNAPSSPSRSVTSHTPSPQQHPNRSPSKTCGCPPR